jgi:hypothetical protein
MQAIWAVGESLDIHFELHIVLAKVNLKHLVISKGCDSNLCGKYLPCPSQLIEHMCSNAETPSPTPPPRGEGLNPL